MRRADFRLPPGETESGAWWVVLSVGLHLIALVAIILAVRRPDDGNVLVGVVMLAAPLDRPEEVDMPWEDLPRPEEVPVQAPDARTQPGIVPGPVALSSVGTPLPDGRDAGAPRLGRGDSLASLAAVGFGPGGVFIAGPAFGSGRLWVPTMDVVLSSDDLLDIADQLGGLDSTVAAMIMAFLDSAAIADSMAVGELPRWTTQINGQTWGTDGQWIYLGPIKIPAVVLALLPLPQGNYDQALAMQRLQRMRAEIMRAARVMEDRALMRDYIRDMRERNERERERRRNREEQRRQEREARQDSVVT